jgi:hypothetical protein
MKASETNEPMRYEDLRDAVGEAMEAAKRAALAQVLLTHKRGGVAAIEVRVWVSFQTGAVRVGAETVETPAVDPEIFTMNHVNHDDESQP